jgi:hypothetical protein
MTIGAVKAFGDALDVVASVFFTHWSSADTSATD